MLKNSFSIPLKTSTVYNSHSLAKDQDSFQPKQLNNFSGHVIELQSNSIFISIKWTKRNRPHTDKKKKEIAKRYHHQSTSSIRFVRRRYFHPGIVPVSRARSWIPSELYRVRSLIKDGSAGRIPPEEEFLRYACSMRRLESVSQGISDETPV